MAVLTNQQRFDVWLAHMRGVRDGFGAVTKADLRAAVDALDDFFDTNVTAINNAFPQPAKAQLTTAQKSLLVRLVIEARYG